MNEKSELFSFFGPTRDQPLNVACVAFAGYSIGRAVNFSNGNLHPDAIYWLTVALWAFAGAVLLPPVRFLQRLGNGPALLVIAGALGLQFGALLTTMPGVFLRLGGPAPLEPYFFGVAAAAVAAGTGLGRKGWVLGLNVFILLAVFAYLGHWLLQTAPNPRIDVYVFQRDASNALLRGQNPYAMTFPDIYGNSPFYGPGLSVNGRLTFGYPYPPLSLLLALPGHVLFGDYRYSQLGAMLLTGALMAFARPGRIGTAAAALYLFSPRVFFVLEQGWTEPFVVLLLAAVGFVACRWPKAVPYVVGLFLAVKQYLVLALPVVLLLLPRPRPSWPELGKSVWRLVATGLIVSLPLVLWDVNAFVKDVVTLQTVQPFRTDALSFLAWSVFQGLPQPSTSLAFGFATLAGVVALWRAPRTASGFAIGVAATFAWFFAYNKQAFCNYYYFVIGACCVAVACADLSSKAPLSTPVASATH